MKPWYQWVKTPDGSWRERLLYITAREVWNAFDQRRLTGLINRFIIRVVTKPRRDE